MVMIGLKLSSPFVIRVGSFVMSSARSVGPNHLPNPVVGPHDLPKLELQSRVLGLGFESESRIPMGILFLGF